MSHPTSRSTNATFRCARFKMRRLREREWLEACRTVACERSPNLAAGDLWLSTRTRTQLDSFKPATLSDDSAAIPNTGMLPYLTRACQRRETVRAVEFQRILSRAPAAKSNTFRDTDGSCGASQSTWDLPVTTRCQCFAPCSYAACVCEPVQALFRRSK